MRLVLCCTGIFVLLLAPGFAQVAAPAAAPPATAAATSAPAVTPQQVEQMQKKLEDWPNLARYREENAKLAKASAGERRVVFLGDSITDGWGRGTGAFFPGKPYVNRGISGQTTPQMLDRFQQDVLHLEPAVVVVLAGINDIAGNTGPESIEAIEDNFRSMVALAKESHVRVVLSSVLPASYFPWRAGLKPAAEVKELNAWLESFAREQHVTFLNYYPALVNGEGGMRPELATDKAVHPNAAGYALMAPLAEEAIAKALAAPAP